MSPTSLSLVVATVAAICMGCTSQSNTENKPVSASEFSITDAQNNLSFAKTQYLKMIDHVENDRNTLASPLCATQTKLCVPRAEEHGKIYLEQQEKWTNGFYPGLLWKLLAAKDQIKDLTKAQEAKLLETAVTYQELLYSEAKRGVTHDLGFILNDSFGEALEYADLDPELRKKYIAALKQGRDTLTGRYTDEEGVIKSWDWIPRIKLHTVNKGKKSSDLYYLSDPWTYPVIVDNMMNLEFLLDSNNPRHHEVAFNHAANTIKNHYYYFDEDKAQQYPIAYHVFDYGTDRPGNWQGVGNISAWARGQGWSLYGFVTVAEAMHKAQIDISTMPNFKQHVSQLYDAIEFLLADDVIPNWDFIAHEEDAYKAAENVSTETTIYSGILNLCDKNIPHDALPYKGYRPIKIDTSLMAEETLTAIASLDSQYNEPIIQGDKVVPCGSKPFDLTGRTIPKDTSAAALIASALYRYATLTATDASEKEKFAGLADKIMLALTTKYRTDKDDSKPHSLDLGFVMAQATGNFPNASEINTPIVYADFYFVEANVRKLEFEASR
ncbi:glycoside hydrolase family 88 protein [Algibacillus agarilyticus]|uniref:glycoside hydrolase family 88 protein n=1 Tax=Algibacillus agarilyticus TaxID=2234133 RepID=UPI000DCFB57A|nr:glycoside hydrolase family 88 protein [Algibacillus agarilyticus]